MRYLLISLLALSILFSCKNENSEGLKNTQDLRTTLKIDSFSYFPAPETRRLSQFIFSPIGEKNKIWAAGIPSYELDLTTGKYTTLTEKYDLEFDALFRDEKSITNDPHSDNIFLTLRNQGILQINKKTGHHHFYKAPAPFAMIFPRKEDVLLSNVDEIFTLDRRTHAYKKLITIPRDISAHNFYSKGNDTLLINNGAHILDLKTLQFSAGIEDRSLSYNTPQPTRSLKKSLKVKGGGNPRIVLQDTIEWYLNNRFIHFSLDGQKLYEYENIPAKKDQKNFLINLLFDDQYIYLLFNHGIGVYNRNHIIDSGVLFNSDLQQHETDLWNTVLQMYADKDVKLPDLIHSIDSIQNIQIENPDVRYKISVLHTKLKEPYSIREPIQLQCEEALKNNTLPKKYIYPACYGLMTLYARKNQIAKAVSFYETMKPLDLNLTDEVMERNFVPILVEVHKELESLKTIITSEDERKFKEAKAKTRIVEALTNFDDSFPDYRPIDKIYKQIIKDNPQGDYADNAAFEIIVHAHRYKDIADIKPLKDWQKWIDMYPQSEIRANAIVKLASYSHTYFYEGENPTISDLEKAHSLLQSIQPEDLKGQKEDSTYYVTLLSEVKRNMFKAHIDIEILPKELIFKLDQPIVFTIRHKNKSKKDFKVDLFAEGSELAIQLYNRSKEIPNDYGDRIMDQIKSETIPAGAFRDCTISLSENSKVFQNGWVEGRYNLSETGIYFINFHSPHNMIGPQTKFEVIN